MGKQVLDTGWLAARSTEVALTGVELTTTHPPAAAAAPWMHAAVPGTYVLLPLLADISIAARHCQFRCVNGDSALAHAVRKD